MKTSIVIRAKNEERFIGQALNMVFAQKYRDPFEVIVLDSGSTDRTVTIASRYPVRLHHIGAGEFTFGRALNAGASLATGVYVVYLSAHCIPADEQWLALLTAPLKEDSAAGTFGRQEPIKGLNPFEELELSAIFPEDSNKPALSIFSNANCAIKKNVLEKYPFDELIPWAEDYLWRRLLPEEMKTFYVPKASVYHSHPLSLRNWARRVALYGECVQYLDKVYGSTYSWGPPSNNIWKLSTNWIKLMRRELTYFLEKDYFFSMLLIPAYEFVRAFFYLKGLRLGSKKYLRKASGGGID